MRARPDFEMLHGVTFVPVARVNGTVIGIDARWLMPASWALLGCIASASLVSASLAAPESPGWVRLLAAPLMIIVVVLTSMGHELGHAFAGALNGVRVRAVVFAPQGGVTIRSRGHTPLVDLATAAAGPLTNLG